MGAESPHASSSEAGPLGPQSEPHTGNGPPKKKATLSPEREENALSVTKGLNSKQYRVHKRSEK